MPWAPARAQSTAPQYRIATVSAPEVHCLFDTDCVINGSDSAAAFALPTTSGQGFLESRTWPAGEPGTAGQDLTAYLYRLNLLGTKGSSCVEKMVLDDFGFNERLDYDGNGSADDVFVITNVGIGSVSPATVSRLGAGLEVSFNPAVCPSESSFFFGVASKESSLSGSAEMTFTGGGTVSVATRIPKPRVGGNEVADASSVVTAYMETHRRLPQSVGVGGFELTTAQFLFAALETLQGLGQQTGSVAVGTAQEPSVPYPSVPMNESFYKTPWERSEIPGVLAELAGLVVSSGNSPAVFQIEGHDLRYPEIVYYLAHLLRSWDFFGELPVRLDKAIIAPQGLGGFSANSNLSHYTSVLTTDSATPFFHNRQRSYYVMPSHHPEVFWQARAIAGPGTDQRAAAEQIYHWVKDRWLLEVGYTTGNPQFETRGSASIAELAQHFQFTSGGPRWPMSLYLRALGIPSSPNGAVWLPGDGWVNMENHKAFGSNLAQNPYYYDSVSQPQARNMPAPAASHDVIERVLAVIQQPAPASTAVKAVFINPQDVLRHGASFVVDRAVQAGFNTLIMTVKSAKGFLYYQTAETARFKGDALQPLLSAAQAQGLQVWAAFSTIADWETGAQHPDWRQQLRSQVLHGSHPNLFISPCVPDYQAYLSARMDELAQGYAIDGVVLTHHYFSPMPGSDKTQGHASCPTTPNAWPEDQLTKLAEYLFDGAKAHRPELAKVVASSPLGRENRYVDLSPARLGHQNLAALSAVTDHVLLVILGDHWVPKATPFWIQAISDYTALTNEAPLVSYYFSDDWTYPVSFYRGLARWVASHDVAGIGFHSALSGQGELGPAFGKGRWVKLSGLDLP